MESKNKDEIAKLIADAEGYLKGHFNKDYYQAVVESTNEEKALAQQKYQQAVAQLNQEHQATVSSCLTSARSRDENYVHKNRLFDAKMQLAKDLQEAKDRRHAAFDHQYHLIDMLRMSKFTFAEQLAQKWENYKYTFNRRDFLLRNGLYLAIIVIFIALCIITPIVKNVPLLTVNNILNILQQASPRMFLALGVAGLILLAGTDLSIGRMVGMGMTAATIVMHQGLNTGSVFGHVFDFSTLPVLARVVLALLVCIVLCTIFTTIAGFFTAKLRCTRSSPPWRTCWLSSVWSPTHQGRFLRCDRLDHPEHDHPKNQWLPNHHPLGNRRGYRGLVHLEQDHLRQKPVCGRRQRRGGSGSGISVFWVTVGAFVLAGILYGFGSWLECIRMVGSGSAAYGQGWEMDAIAACVVGGISFTGGIGKISGVVVGVFIFTALTYSLTTLGIDTTCSVYSPDLHPCGGSEAASSTFRRNNFSFMQKAAARQTQGRVCFAAAFPG